MARYDVYLNPNGRGYLLNVQAELLDELSTCVVVPLLANGPGVKTIRKLNPIFMINGKQYVMFTHLIGTIPVSRLPEPQANLLSRHDTIVSALDMLFQGF